MAFKGGFSLFLSIVCVWFFSKTPVWFYKISWIQCVMSQSIDFATDTVAAAAADVVVIFHWYAKIVFDIFLLPKKIHFRSAKFIKFHGMHWEEGKKRATDLRSCFFYAGKYFAHIHLWNRHVIAFFINRSQCRSFLRVWDYRFTLQKVLCLSASFFLLFAWIFGFCAISVE